MISQGCAMKYHKIPHSNLEVSKIALGTMTYGEQNTQKEAFEQLDYALERGVNFIDTARKCTLFRQSLIPKAPPKNILGIG